uniref:Uncharacterized protein n=1 Tax=Lepeophtheirus salmonis TaxID=72036 RepID=A0A0K2VL54_LEPSM
MLLSREVAVELDNVSLSFLIITRIFMILTIPRDTACTAS